MVASGVHSAQEGGRVENVVGVVLVIAFLAAFFGASYWIFLHDGLLDRHVDALRRKLTTGLEVGARDQEVHRGDQVEAIVTVSRRRGLGQVEVGLVCTERYDYENTWTDKDGGTQSSRETAEEYAHEESQTAGPGVGQQSFRFTLPSEAPFSYNGECLSFRWEVVALGRRSRRLDAQARSELWVLP
jgi:hypothetical protein